MWRRIYCLGMVSTRRIQVLVIALWVASGGALGLALYAYLWVFDLVGHVGDTHWDSPMGAALLTVLAAVAGFVSLVNGLRVLNPARRTRRDLAVFILATLGFIATAAALPFVAVTSVS